MRRRIAHAAPILLALALAQGSALGQGRAIRVELEGADGPIRSGESATVSVRVQDPASGFPLTGLTPALWLLPLMPDEVEEDCERWVHRLAGAAAPPRGGVDVNGFDLIQATTDGKLVLVDPLLNLASANIKGIVDLGEVPAAWTLDQGGRNLLAATASDQRLHRIDLDSFKQVDSIKLSATPTSMLTSAGIVWIGLDDGSAQAVGVSERLQLGEGKVRLSATPLGALAVAASGRGAYLRGSQISATVDFGMQIRALGYSSLADSGYALSFDGRALLVAPQDSPQMLRTIELPRRMLELAVDPVGHWIALIAEDGGAVSIVDTARGRVRWTIEVDDPLVAVGFSDSFLYLMHAHQGGASRVVFDPAGGPPGVVTISAGSGKEGEQRVDQLPMLARIPSAGMLLASRRDRQAFMVNDDNAQAAMSSLPLRAGAPAGILLRYRGLTPSTSERGLYRAGVVLPRGGGYLAVVRTEQPALAHCARLAVAPARDEVPVVAMRKEPPVTARELQVGVARDRDGQVLEFVISGLPEATLLEASLVGNGWQRTPRDLERGTHGYRMHLGDTILPFTLFVRYRDRADGPARVLATTVDVGSVAR